MNEETIQMVKEAARGSRPAWNRLVAKFQKRIFGIAMVITKDINDADDATQNTFVALFKNLKHIDNPEKIEGWLIRTAINKSKDLLRRKKIRSWLPLSKVNKHDQSSPEYDIYMKEVKEIFEVWSRNNLSQKEQIIFQLRFGDGKELSEIAEDLQMNINTVKTHLHRAMKKLKPKAANLFKEKKDE